MGKKKILVIDDEESFTKMVKLNLEETGEYEVRTCNKGTKAIQSVQDFRPDLIFLDIVIPDIDGSEVMKQLKSDRMAKDIPVIFLTAIVKKDEVSSKGGYIGGYPFLSKPVSTKELIDCIKKYTGG